MPVAANGAPVASTLSTSILLFFSSLLVAAAASAGASVVDSSTTAGTAAAPPLVTADQLQQDAGEDAEEPACTTGLRDAINAAITHIQGSQGLGFRV